MGTTLTLIGVVFALLVVLEVASALFDAVVQGIGRDMARNEAVPIYLMPPMLLRWGLALLVRVGGTTSLVVHELSHALGQLVFGGRPRVVFLKNGGFAESRPWNNSYPARVVYAVGGFFGRGLICTAPLLVSAALLVATLVIATSLTHNDVLDAGRTLGTTDGHAVREVLATTWAALAGAHWWIYPILVLVAVLLAPSMTPSTVDYIHARTHLLAYALAALACAGIAEHAPRLLWVAAPVAAVAGVLGLGRGPEWARSLLGGTGLGMAVLALVLALVGRGAGASPLAALHTGLGVIAFAFGLAALVYAVFVAVFLGLSLISVRPRTLWYALAATPGRLVDLVRTFSTCEACKMHYRGRCEGCGRTPEGPPESQTPTQT
ncbi:MAG: hypothetical protein NT062_23295 [Proteobacteria bacterium]|nr:hypothetical protein [Pseudomonadota bacterium]